jgi:hypothetical protein
MPGEMPGAPDDPPLVLHVACLCAAWCRLCDSYGALFDAAVAEIAALGCELRAHWIDIEDEAELLGDLEVQTFPTLVVADDHSVRFAGPLEPQPQTLKRMLAAAWSAAREGAAAVPQPAEIEAFARLLRQRSDIRGKPRVL